MRIAILTFQFAQNYGAVLQAFALREYLSSLGHQVDIAPYYPFIFHADYEISPLAKGVPLKRRVKLALRYAKRKRQTKLFEHFRQAILKTDINLETEKELKEYLDQYDLVVCGSDQIWNERLTGDTTAYFAAGTRAALVAYGASIGTKEISKSQQDKVRTYLPQFRSVSVREPEGQTILNKVIDIPVELVIDPVFLLSAEVWKQRLSFAAIEQTSPYMLLYLLQDDPLLLQYAIQYAQQNNIELVEIHPTLARFHKGTRHLECVGPDEFLYLVKNAECVCTNSFHATAFSVIFQKRLIHIPNSSSPERTRSLLRHLGVQMIENNNRLPLYDLQNYSLENLNGLILNSQNFLKDALKNK